ncbi:MAG: hypothetical protein AABM66_14740 [Actinomycetota bacterium]
MTTKSEAPSILPDHLAIPALAEATDRLAKAADAVRAAQQETLETRAAVEAAPATDKAAVRAAVEAGKPTPERTEPIRKAEHAAARRRLDAANAFAREAADGFRALLVQHREELDALQAPRVTEAASAVDATLATLGAQLDDLAREVGIWRELHAVTARRETTPADERSRMLGREPAAALPNFGAARNAAVKQLAAVRATVEELQAQPTPAPDRQAERQERRRQRRERLTGTAA